MSLLAFVRAFEPSALLRVRETTDGSIPKVFGHYLTKYGCSCQTSWLLTQGGEISSDTSVLNAKGDPGGQQQKDPTAGMLSSYLQLAKWLRIPKDLRVCIRTDSTLTLFKTGLQEYERHPWY